MLGEGVELGEGVINSERRKEEEGGREGKGEGAGGK